MKTKVQIKIFTVTSESVLPLKHITLHLHEKISTKIHVHMINVSCWHQFQSASRSSSSRTDELNSEKPLRSPAGASGAQLKTSPLLCSFLSGFFLSVWGLCPHVARLHCGGLCSLWLYFSWSLCLFSWSSESVFSVTLFVLPFVAGTVLSPVFSSDESVNENLESLARVELATFTFVWSVLGGDCGCLLVLPLFSPGERLSSLDSSCCWCSVSSDVPFWAVLTSSKTWEETSLVLLLVPSRGFLLALLPSAGRSELDRFPLSACFSGIWGAVGFYPLMHRHFSTGFHNRRIGMSHSLSGLECEVCEFAA